MLVLLLTTLIMSLQGRHFLVRFSLSRFGKNVKTFFKVQTSSGEKTGTGKLNPGQLKILFDSFLKEQQGQKKTGVRQKKTTFIIKK